MGKQIFFLFPEVLKVMLMFLVSSISIQVLMISRPTRIPSNVRFAANYENGIVLAGRIFRADSVRSML